MSDFAKGIIVSSLITVYVIGTVVFFSTPGRHVPLIDTELADEALKDAFVEAVRAYSKYKLDAGAYDDQIRGSILRKGDAGLELTFKIAVNDILFMSFLTDAVRGRERGALAK